jgi:hypothetical protein
VPRTPAHQTRGSFRALGLGGGEAPAASPGAQAAGPEGGLPPPLFAPWGAAAADGLQDFLAGAWRASPAAAPAADPSVRGGRSAAPAAGFSGSTNRRRASALGHWLEPRPGADGSVHGGRGRRGGESAPQASVQPEGEAGAGGAWAGSGGGEDDSWAAGDVLAGIGRSAFRQRRVSATLHGAGTDGTHQPGVCFPHGLELLTPAAAGGGGGGGGGGQGPTLRRGAGSDGRGGAVAAPVHGRARRGSLLVRARSVLTRVFSRKNLAIGPGSTTSVQAPAGPGWDSGGEGEQGASAGANARGGVAAQRSMYQSYSMPLLGVLDGLVRTMGIGATGTERGVGGAGDGGSEGSTEALDMLRVHLPQAGAGVRACVRDAVHR